MASAPNVLVVAHIAGEYLFGSERSFLDMLHGFAQFPANVYVALPQNVPAYTNAVRELSILSLCSSTIGGEKISRYPCR